MKATTSLKNDIIKDEGYRQFPYLCTSEKMTIAIGRNLDDVGLSEDEAVYLLENDLKRCIREANDIFSSFDSHNQTRKEVIINMLFNLGKTRFLGFVNTIQAFKDKDYMLTGSEMMDSKWYRKGGSRVARLVQEMKSGDK